MLISSPLILSWNPTAGNSSLVALADILFVLLGWFVISINPLAAMAVSAGLWTNSQILFVYNVPLQTGGTLPMFSPWVLFSITSILLSLTLFWASTHFAGKPGK